MIIIKQNGDILELNVQEYKELYGEVNSYNNNFYCPGYYPYYPDYYKYPNIIYS